MLHPRGHGMFFFRTPKAGNRKWGPTPARTLAAVFLLVFLGATSGAFGETQYVQRKKVEIREGQGSFYPVLHVAVLGDPLDVIVKDQGWFKVNTPKGPGWVFSQALGPEKPRTFQPFAGSAQSSELDKTAGFKGFDRATEDAFVARENLAAQMQQVKDMEKVPFSVSELRTFQLKGRVGPWGAKTK